MSIKKNKQKLFVFDLDGTLLNSNSKIIEENIEALQKAKNKGHILTFATGRNYIFSRDVLNDYWDLFDYYIGCNGAILHYIFDRKYKNISKSIDLSIVDYLINYLKENGGGIQISTVWKIYSDVYITNDKQWFATKENIKYFKQYPSPEQITDDEKKSIIQISVHLEENKVRKFKDEMINKYGNEYNLYITSKYNVDINISGLSKLKGIKHIVNKENISFENVYIFGDSQNDIEGLKYYNNTFAMGNAFDEVKKSAKFVIEDNNTNAIAKIVNKNI